MHNVFTTMGTVGNIIGALFYLLVIFAGVSSAISLMEVTTSAIIDGRAEKGKKSNRKAVTFIVAAIMFVISIPICLDELGLAGEDGFFWPLYSYLGEGSQDLLDFYDMITEGLMMPLGALLMCILVGWKLGFGLVKDEVLADGRKWKMEKFFEFCTKYTAPLILLFTLVSLFMSYLGL